MEHSLDRYGRMALCMLMLVGTGVTSAGAPQKVTKATTTPPIPTTAFVLSMVISNRIFNDSLLNKKLPDYKNMYKEVDDVLNIVLSCVSCGTRSFYTGVQDMTFTHGSVIAISTIKFQTYIPVNAILIQNIFQETIKSDGGHIKGLTIKSELIQVVQAPSISTSPTSASSSTTSVVTNTTTPNPTSTATTHKTTTFTSPSPKTTTLTTTSPKTTTLTATSPNTTTITATSTKTTTLTATSPKTTTITATSPNTTTLTATSTKTTTLTATSHESTTHTSTRYTTTMTSGVPSKTTSSSFSSTTTQSQAHLNLSSSTTTKPFSKPITKHTENTSTNNSTQPLFTKPSSSTNLSSSTTKRGPEPLLQNTTVPGGGDGYNHYEGVPGWAIALLVLACIILVLLIILLIIAIVRCCTEDKVVDSNNVVPEEHTPYGRRAFKEPLSTPYSPHTPQKSPIGSPFEDPTKPRVNRAGMYIVNPDNS